MANSIVLRLAYIEVRRMNFIRMGLRGVMSQGKPVRTIAKMAANIRK